MQEKYGLKFIIFHTSLTLSTGLYIFMALPGDMLLETEYVASCIVLSHNHLSDGTPCVTRFLTPYTPYVLSSTKDKWQLT